MVNSFRNAPFLSGYSREKNLNEIRLAREAMSVPRPPRFTPVSSEEKSLLNPDSRIADDLTGKNSDQKLSALHCRDKQSIDFRNPLHVSDEDKET